MTTPETPTSVGKQLKARREALNLTQAVLAALVNVDAGSVSGAERDTREITRGKRASWENALRLVPGTITRAYQEGTAIEVLDNAVPEVDANLDDEVERAALALNVTAAEKQMLIGLYRAALARASSRRRPA